MYISYLKNRFCQGCSFALFFLHIDVQWLMIEYSGFFFILLSSENSCSRFWVCFKAILHEYSRLPPLFGMILYKRKNFVIWKKSREEKRCQKLSKITCFLENKSIYSASVYIISIVFAQSCGFCEIQYSVCSFFFRDGAAVYL